MIVCRKLIDVVLHKYYKVFGLKIVYASYQWRFGVCRIKFYNSGSGWELNSTRRVEQFNNSIFHQNQFFLSKFFPKPKHILMFLSLTYYQNICLLLKIILKAYYLNIRMEEINLFVYYPNKSIKN